MKFPQPCEALSAIRPVQIVGGEQTLFAVTAEGKVCLFVVPSYCLVVIQTLLFLQPLLQTTRKLYIYICRTSALLTRTHTRCLPAWVATVLYRYTPPDMVTADV